MNKLKIDGHRTPELMISVSHRGAAVIAKGRFAVFLVFVGLLAFASVVLVGGREPSESPEKLANRIYTIEFTAKIRSRDKI